LPDTRNFKTDKVEYITGALSENLSALDINTFYEWIKNIEIKNNISIV